MTRRLTLAVLLVAFAVVMCAQQGLDGVWEGETRAGASLVLTLEVKDATLTGTLVREGQSTPITDGKASKNTFTFKATLGDRQESFSGEQAGDEIKVWLDRQGPATAIVLRRGTSKK